MKMASRYRRSNLIKKLSIREISGEWKMLKKSPCMLPFTKIPRRMCYRLQNLVPRSVLENGYVFLGFTKSGTFVVSYSLQFNMDSEVPSYKYKLQWWLFAPKQPLYLFSEVELFGDNDISSELYIAFCEWPEDNQKIFVYGHSISIDHNRRVQVKDDQPCFCYITITPVPHIGHCSQCSMVSMNRKERPQSGNEISDKPSKKCVLHSYCVHSRFELSPPYPPFSPTVQLKLDGIVILNTGISLIVFQVELFFCSIKFCSGIVKWRSNTHTCHTVSAKTGEQNVSHSTNSPFDLPLCYNGSDIAVQNLCEKCRKLLHETKCQTKQSNDCDNYTIHSLCSASTESLISNENKSNVSGELDEEEIVFNGSVPSVKTREETFFSPSNSNSATSTDSSEVFRNISTNCSRAISYSSKFFHMYDDLNAPEPVEDEYDIAYKSELPVNVFHYGNPLHSCKSISCSKPNLAVLQMVFDIENYMVEVVGQKANWGKRFVAFYNYDLQILDVDLDCQVFATVYALIEAKQENGLDKGNEIYQSQFTFQLNLFTGFYSTIHIDDLVKIGNDCPNEYKWNLDAKRQLSLKNQKMAMPKSFYRNVNVLSNEAACVNGISKRLLIAPYQSHTTAILL